MKNWLSERKERMETEGMSVEIVYRKISGSYKQGVFRDQVEFRRFMNSPNKMGFLAQPPEKVYFRGRAFHT